MRFYKAHAPHTARQRYSAFLIRGSLISAQLASPPFSAWTSLLHPFRTEEVSVKGSKEIRSIPFHSPYTLFFACNAAPCRPTQLRMEFSHDHAVRALNAPLPAPCRPPCSAFVPLSWTVDLWGRFIMTIQSLFTLSPSPFWPSALAASTAPLRKSDVSNCKRRAAREGCPKGQPFFYAVSCGGIHEPLSHFVMHVTDK